MRGLRSSKFCSNPHAAYLCSAAARRFSKRKHVSHAVQHLMQISTLCKKETHVTQDSKRFAWHFIQLMFAAFLLFFLTAMMGKASVDLVVYMNDPKVSKQISEWVVFGVGAPLATALWGLLWIWFKISEKYCIELFGKLQAAANPP